MLLLILAASALLLLFGRGTAVLHLRQPATKKKVVELAVRGWFGQWMMRNNWAGYTLALPLITLIFYWLKPDESPDPFVRVHEFVHVRQGEDAVFAFLFWVRYDREAIEHGYDHNKYEVEAYAVEAEAARTGLPDWAK